MFFYYSFLVVDLQHEGRGRLGGGDPRPPRAHSTSVRRGAHEARPGLARARLRAAAPRCP